LAATEHTEEALCLINALRWKFSARDHRPLAALKLFSALRSPERVNLLSKSWGQQLPQKVCKSTYD